MNKKTIGIPAYKNEQQNSFGVGISYLNWVSRIGNPRIIMPHEEYVEDIDLLLLPGGLDINPSSNDQIPSFKTSNTDVFKQFFYDKRLDNYIGNKPIVGVCLGMQALAVRFGSKLTQHLYDHNYYSEPRDKAEHDAFEFNDGRRVQLKNNRFAKQSINSLHHQGIYHNDLSPNLEMILGVESDHYTNKYVVEAFRHRELPILGFQYHIEEMHDDYSFNLINNLISTYVPVEN